MQVIDRGLQSRYAMLDLARGKNLQDFLEPTSLRMQSHYPGQNNDTLK